MKTCSLLLLWFLVSCATPTRQTDALVVDQGDLPQKMKLEQIPFIEQKKYHCGPASLAMVMKYKGSGVALEEITSQVYTNGAKGTFQTEMISAVRRNGMLAIPVHDLPSLLKELQHGNPAIVFMNLGFTHYPLWHYAVLTGYDLEGPDLWLHSGRHENEKWDMRLFEHSWNLGGKWAMVITRPDELAVSASDMSHVAEAAQLEKLDKLDEARRSYETALSRWPTSLGALLGLGNVYFSKVEFKKAITYLKLASRYHPNSPLVWHNLAIAQGAAGLKQEANKSSKRAMELVEQDMRDEFAKNLGQWLTLN